MASVFSVCLSKRNSYFIDLFRSKNRLGRQRLPFRLVLYLFYGRTSDVFVPPQESYPPPSGKRPFNRRLWCEQLEKRDMLSASSPLPYDTPIDTGTGIGITVIPR